MALVAGPAMSDGLLWSGAGGSPHVCLVVDDRGKVHIGTFQKLAPNLQQIVTGNYHLVSDGKIITVDERFTIAQAVAIKNDRIMAVGTNQEIAQLAGPNTRKIDLKGKSVIPGLIDNHTHLLRAGTTW